MDRHVYFVAHLDPGEIHERSIKDDALGVADLGDGLGHDCNTMFYQQTASSASCCGSELAD